MLSIPKPKEPIRLDEFFWFWLGWQDSNLRMQQSKCCVLPLDDTPIFKMYFIKNAAAFVQQQVFHGALLHTVKVVGWKMGLEPTVSSATNWRFNQLSYIHHSAKVIISFKLQFVNKKFKKIQIFLL